MRIGIDARMTGKMQATGIGNYLEQVIKRLLILDEINQYFIFVKPENKTLVNFLIHKYNNVKIVTTSCHWYTLCEQIKFCTLLYKYNLDLVHFPQFNVPVLYFKKFIVTIHDLTALKHPGPKMKSTLRRLAFYLVFYKAVHSSIKIITVSQYTKNEILKIYPKIENKIIITSLGVDKNFEIKLNYGKIKSIKEQFKITKPYIFYVGVWRVHKNIHGLIDAFQILQSVYNNDIQLVLGGVQNQNYPELMDSMIGLSDKIKSNIITTGFINEEDLPYFYQGALCYVVPSFEEGFGLNGLEAMQSQIPVLASKTGCLKEIYGDSAIYFNPFKKSDIAHKINQVIKNKSLKDKLIKKGNSKVKEYNWDKTAKETLNIYNSLLKAKR